HAAGQACSVVPHDPGQLGRAAHGAFPTVHPAARPAALAAGRCSRLALSSRRNAAPESARPVVPDRSRAGRHFGGGLAMNPLRAQSAPVMAGVFLGAVLCGLVGYFGLWQWMICRIEVPAGYSLLVRYKGPWPFGTTSQPPQGTLVRLDAAGHPLQVGIL